MFPVCRLVCCLNISEEYSCEYGSGKFFALCGLGGFLSCGITHTAVVPLDLVKCRIQVDPAKYGGIFKGFRVTIADEGMRGLSKGWAPTFFGYSMQGIFKFGFYEIFKVLYSNLLGEVCFSVFQFYFLNILLHILMFLFFFEFYCILQLSIGETSIYRIISSKHVRSLA